MKAFFISAAALTALAAATPASAQDYRGYGYGYSARWSQAAAARTGAELERLGLRLREGVQSGAFEQWEARRLYRALRRLQDLRIQYIRTRGMSPWEARDLETRIQQLRYEFRLALSRDRRYGAGRDFDRGPGARAPDPDDDLRRAPDDFGDPDLDDPDFARPDDPDDPDDPADLRGGPDDDPSPFR
jgi:hypothetical protein